MHGYVDANGKSIIQSFNNFKNALVAGGAGNKPIWDTEWSWWPDNPPPQDVQAAFLSTSLILQSALGVQSSSTMLTTASTTAFTTKPPVR